MSKPTAPTRPQTPVPPPGDGTTQLLRSGFLMLGVGIACFLVLFFVLGGIDVDGAHSNTGWLALVFGMMCVPFGLLLTLLGVAKWVRNRSLSRP
jgi:hypothetical protein